MLFIFVTSIIRTDATNITIAMSVIPHGTALNLTQSFFLKFRVRDDYEIVATDSGCKFTDKK